MGFDIGGAIGLDPNTFLGQMATGVSSGAPIGQSLFDYMMGTYGKPNNSNPTFTQGNTPDSGAGKLNAQPDIQSKSIPALSSIATPNPYGGYTAGAGIQLPIQSSNPGQGMSVGTSQAQPQQQQGGFDAQKFGQTMSLLGLI